MNIKLVALLAIMTFVIAACGQGEKTETTLPSTPEVLDEAEVVEETTQETDETVREFRFTGHMFYFEDDDGVQNPDIIVNVGDRVRIEFDNVEGIHDWVVDEFEGAQTELLQPGQSQTIEFIVTEAGEFEYYCSYMRHREMGMFGRLIVQ
jgi:nitrite reductase (NO-forming)